MKIFISWSGEPSHQIAVELRNWLSDVLPSAKCFVSSEDLRKGSRWGFGLDTELSETNFGIICLTATNLAAPWLIFEAGALSKSMVEGRVCTLLLGGLKYTEVTGPLEKFQNTHFEREDMWKLLKDINTVTGEGARDPDSLQRVFVKFWPDLKANVEQACAHASAQNAKQPPKRSVESMFEELLELARTSSRREDIARQESFVATRLKALEQTQMFALWTTFLDEVHQRSKPLYEILKSGTVGGAQGKNCFVYFASPIKPFMDQTTEIPYGPIIKEVSEKVYGDRNLCLVPLSQLPGPT